MLYHGAAWKGAADGIEALRQARNELPDLDAVLFGTDRRPSVPEWMTYVHNPTGDALVDLYNSLSIFLHPSWAEGWPLPPAESMACGCALVATANAGVSDYAHDGETAVMSPVRSPDALAGALIRVLRDQDLRLQLARAGNRAIQKMTWQRATDTFERVIQAVPD
jgi:glycosyltransferase involved in cell wall biosynthesis